MEQNLNLVVEGRKFFEKKDYEKAAKCFVAALKSHKNFADVHNMLGVIYHQTGEFSQAIECFEKAIKINPHYTEALLNLAVLYNDLGKYKKASVLYAKVQADRHPKKKEKMDPFIKNKLANKHAEIGDLYEGIGLYPEAIIEYDKALSLRPQFLDIRLKHAICLREKGQHNQAIKVLEKVLKANPSYANARIQLGITYYAIGKNKKAAECWEKTLKIDPSDESAKMYLKLSAQSK